MKKTELKQVAKTNSFDTSDFLKFVSLGDNRKKFHVYMINRTYYCPTRYVPDLVADYRMSLYKREKNQLHLFGRILKMFR